jgi:hypothetical protein
MDYNIFYDLNKEDAFDAFSHGFDFSFSLMGVD